MSMSRFPMLALVALSLGGSVEADESPVDGKAGGGAATAQADVQAISGRAERVFTDLDANEDGLLTKDEISPERMSFFEHLLRVADKDKDGSLTKAEFISGLSPRNTGPAADAPKEESDPGATRPRFDPEVFFRRIDRNGDGQLSVEELPEPFRGRAVAALQELGRDKNGTLSLEEFRKHVGMSARPRLMDVPGAPGNSEVPAFFRKLDRNGDGKLSRAELNAAAQLLDEFDVDHDGQLNMAELFGRPAGRVEMRSTPSTGGGAGNTRPGPESGKKGEKDPQRPRVVAPAVTPDAPAKGNARPAGAFRRFDQDGDGKVSREEAPPNLKRNFEKLDTNGDGYLDPAELRKALEQFRAPPARAPNA